MPDLFSFNPVTLPINEDYLLTIFKGIRHTKIRMSCSSPIINTSQIPHTYSVLEKMLPSVFRSKCFNEMNYPFSVEVKRTEIAHLFEHILLEYICIRKLAHGKKSASVSGTTDWDWGIDPQGTFNITIRIGRNEQEVFDEALDHTAKLFGMILNNSLSRKKQTVIQ